MRRRPVWTVERIRALGVATDLATAASVLGIGRTLAYELVAAGQFPVPVIRAGRRVIVPVTPLLTLLRVDAPDGSDEPDRRLDRSGEPSVDATTIHPADSPGPNRRGDHHDNGDHL